MREIISEHFKNFNILLFFFIHSSGFKAFDLNSIEMSLSEVHTETEFTELSLFCWTVQKRKVIEETKQG